MFREEGGVAGCLLLGAAVGFSFHVYVNHLTVVWDMRACLRVQTSWQNWRNNNHTDQRTVYRKINMTSGQLFKQIVKAAQVDTLGKPQTDCKMWPSHCELQFYRCCWSNNYFIHDAELQWKHTASRQHVHAVFPWCAIIGWSDCSSNHFRLRWVGMSWCLHFCLAF